MGLKISAVLINRVVPEEEQMTLVRKYYRSYSRKGEVTLEEALHPTGRDMFFGRVGDATILTHYEIPYLINHYPHDIGVYEQKHPLFSKLTKTFPTEDLFCCYFNSVGVYFSYSFIRAGLRTRFRRSDPPDNMVVEEAGNLLPEEVPYYAFSRILPIEPGRPLKYPNGAFIHTTLKIRREYYREASLDTDTPESRSEFQAGNAIIMDVSRSFLGERLDRLPLERIAMTRYAK